MMYLPNYDDGSIVNLMSSLLQASGANSPYNPLPALPPAAIADVQNIVLLVIDGLGYEYLVNLGHETIFQHYLRGNMTTVFPSTTAAGITTFLSGLAPQQHAMTGWFMHLKEFGAVSTILRFQPRCCDLMFSSQEGVKPDMIFNYPTIFEQITRQPYAVNPQRLKKTAYASVANKYAQTAYFKTFSGCLRQIKRIVTANSEKKFIYAYWGEFDHLCHEHGTTSTKVTDHFAELAKLLERFVHALANTPTTLIITADHGMIDTESSKIIQVKHHPGLRNTLILPLCGEPRAAYCYVHPAKTDQFETYIAQHFGHICELYRSEELIANHYFGLFEPDQRLFDRVGDYVLIMRDNYVIKDFLLGEEEKFHIGNHDGVSKEEMFVPLVVINT
jgi:hypothetical protein